MVLLSFLEAEVACKELTALALLDWGYRNALAKEAEEIVLRSELLGIDVFEALKFDVNLILSIVFLFNSLVYFFLEFLEIYLVFEHFYFEYVYIVRYI